MKAQLALNKYSDNLVGLQALDNQMKDLIDSVIPQEMKDQIKDIKEEFEAKAAPLELENEKLITLIKKEVIALGSTINGEFHQAVYSKPRVSWDTSGLAGYSVAHPEVQVFQKVGESSASIRAKRQ